MNDELVGKRNWWRVLETAAALDSPTCIAIMKELKSGPLCINDLAGYLKQHRNVIFYNCDILLRAALIERSEDSTLKYPDSKEVFALTENGKIHTRMK